MDPVRLVVERGGACQRSDVLNAGATRRALDAAITRGDLVRAGRSGLTRPGAPRALVAAVGHRAVLACLSALEFEQSPVLLVPDVPHLASSRHRTGPGRVWHRLPRSSAGALAVPLATAVAQVARCRPAPEVLAAVDAVLRSGRLTREEVAAELHAHEVGLLRWALRHADPRSESVLESALRAVLLTGGVGGLELQAPLHGIGRVDLLVDGWLVLEADGYRFHSGRSDYRTDRRRTVAATVAGYVTLRFSWEEIVLRPDEVLHAVRATLDRRRAGAFRTVR